MLVVGENCKTVKMLVPRSRVTLTESISSVETRGTGRTRKVGIKKAEPRVALEAVVMECDEQPAYSRCQRSSDGGQFVSGVYPGIIRSG